MVQELEPEAIQIKVHELSMLKQVIESRSHALEVVREALSNMCTPEVGATQVWVQFFPHPELDGTFIFRDDGCGMDYTGKPEEPGRLDRFLNLGYSAAAGIAADRYGWKGLGSKLMFNCRRLEVQTWSGDAGACVYEVKVENPRGRLLQDVPEWPNAYLTRRPAEATDRKGTTITMGGVEGGNVNYTYDELRHYLYWNSIVGITRDERLPRVYLKVGLHEEELPLGYRWIRQRDDQGPRSWRTVLLDPPIETSEIAASGEEVRVSLKGGFTLDTADACGPGEGLTPQRGNTGLRLSVLGIPYFKLIFYRLRGERFQMLESLCSLVAECDQLSTRLNIDRSGYNKDDPVVRAFEKAVTKAFDQLAQSQAYRTFEEKRRREDEVTKGKFLNERKTALNQPDQEYVCITDDEGNLRVIHRVPENEQDSLALFWKLEGAGVLPFAQFLSLEHTNKSGIDVIADFQEEEDSQLQMAAAVEFEHTYENFLAHAHNPRQTSMVVCWRVRNPANLHALNDWSYRGQVGQQVLTVVELQKLPGIAVKRRAEVR